MGNRELAFVKQALLTTTDWDVFQTLLRKCLELRKVEGSSKSR